ncbi:MAG TPA: hypothetical protein VFB82_07395, partial [Blastocatellia bacterium]|nr:hypothetical protein [Blastocatellia bacterium]
MRNHQSRTIRILVLLSLLGGNGNGGVPSFFGVNSAPSLDETTENNDTSKSELPGPALNGAVR